MDKQTLSNYGWLVIVTLILAVMLALATPFGTYVSDAVINISNSYANANADGIILRSFAMHDMELPEKLLAVARAGAGTNNIPIDKCSDKGIVVFNTPGANANAVKELVIAGLFMASRKITDGIAWANTLTGDDVAKQVEKGKSNFAGQEIQGKTLGVIGLGAIGVLVANAAHHLGMKVIGYDPYLSVDYALKLSSHVNKAKDLKEIYAESDYITIHVPLTPDTKNLVNSDTISLMKDGVRILNFARGELVNNDDIKAALAAGKVASYVVDFPNAETVNQPGIVAIPHLGASTIEFKKNTTSSLSYTFNLSDKIIPDFADYNYIAKFGENMYDIVNREQDKNRNKRHTKKGE